MKFAAYVEPQYFHLIDHLAPICELLNAPMIFSTENEYEIAKKYYPNLNLIFTDDLLTDFFVKHFDVILHCLLWSNIDLKFKPSFIKYNKKIKTIYVSHGNSDKGYGGKIMEQFAIDDVGFLYGQQIINLLKEQNVYDRMKSQVITGNLRYPYYLKHKSFFTKFIEDEILIHLYPDKKTILYAPTWKDAENSSFFMESYEAVLEHLPQNYNLIIKIHPEIEKSNPGIVWHLLGKYKNQKGIICLFEFPLIYPLLDICDIYIGDHSSIGYDFLAFNRPMFFLNLDNRDKNDKKRYLHKCGIEINSSNLHTIDKTIENNVHNDKVFKAIRDKMYKNTFAKVDLQEIKTNIYSVCKN